MSDNFETSLYEYIPVFLTPEEYYNRWVSQKHIMREPDLWNKESLEIAKFDDVMYIYNGHIEEYNEWIDYVSDYGNAYEDYFLNDNYFKYLF